MKIPFWPKFKGYRDIELGLNRILKALKRLQNPHLKLPKTIHIAGTNGKGSTLAFIKSILISNNYKVHSYSSPHLVEFNERIEVANNKISDILLNQYLLRCEEVCEMEPKIELTFFEGTTLAAFLAFSEIEADFLLLETGLGGRLDATNVIQDPIASIITPIDIDHSEFLGSSIPQIAKEKAGIIKNNSNVITSKQTIEAIEQITQINNQKIKNNIFQADSNYNIREDGTGLTFNCDFPEANEYLKTYFMGNGDLKISKPKNLFQEHQIQNLATALATIVSCNIETDIEKLNIGIETAFWPARLQKIKSGFLHDKISSSNNFELFLDGGHNPAAAREIAKFLDKNQEKNITLIFSMLVDKDFKSFLKNISEKIDYLIHCPVINLQTVKFKDLQGFVLAEKLISAKSIENSIHLTKKTIDPDSDNLVLICGSLYLAGEFLKLNQTKP